MNDALVLLGVVTALRVFLPDLQAGTRRLLRAAVRAGVAELVQTRPAEVADTRSSTLMASSADREAQIHGQH